MKQKHIIYYNEALDEKAFERLKKQCNSMFGKGNFLILEGGLKYGGLTEVPLFGEQK